MSEETPDQNSKQKPDEHVQTAQITGTVQIKPQDNGKQGEPQQGKDDTLPEDETPEKKSGRKFIIIGVLALLVIVGLLFYWHSTYYEDTDDAQVDGDLYQVSARVGGQVVKVYVEDNQQVNAGDPIAEIDPKDYQVALDQAQANLASAEADYEQAKVNVPITNINVTSNVNTASSSVLGAVAQVSQSKKQVEAAQARVEQAKANALKAQDDVDRYTPLVKRDVISKQQFDAAVAARDAAKSQVLEAQADVIAAEDGVRQAQQKLQQSQIQSSASSQNASGQRHVEQARADAAAAAVRQQQAKLQQAQLNLSYTHIMAPATGIVNKKSVVVGTNLSPGQDLLTIIPLDNLWVTANFKETQLEKMKPGQKVVIEVDALGGRKYDGKVTQIGGATGSKLSLFPPENATGNYVKVVQRLPVRIDFTDLKDENKDHLLRPGYSVTPKVSVK
ncbi:MAG TPA: HlyD family secretion protein [Acidobacteriaceae bacterium]